GVLVTSVLSGYAFARLRFAGRDALFLIVLATMMVPAQATLIPSFILVRQLGWIDTYQGLIIPRLVTAFGIFMMRQFFMSIPKDLEDAARVDGCSRIRTLVQIMLPLSGPALATLAIFSFTQSWNEFFWPLIVVQTPGMRTVQVAIAALKATELVEWGVVMAVVTIASLPTLLVYFAFQRYFVRGIMMSGLKG
ncbi:MAG: carbohydrate ABC transporter permease, partial [Chloroflexota bacterium]